MFVVHRDSSRTGSFRSQMSAAYFTPKGVKGIISVARTINISRLTALWRIVARPVDLTVH